MFYKTGLLQVLPNSQENTYAGFFKKQVAGLRPSFIKKRLRHGRFPLNFPKFLRTLFSSTYLDTCFCFFQKQVLDHSDELLR